VAGNVAGTSSQSGVTDMSLYVTRVALALLAVLMTALPTSAATGETLANARDATAVYADPAAALAGGYELLTDSAGIACIDMAGSGGMGVHFVKGALVQSGKLDAARPQALVYDVQPDGRLHLAAVEYVVFQSAWDEAHQGPPSLFGQTFSLTPADNRFGLPAFYQLHAWVGTDNPSGAFSTWNPSVSCGGGDNVAMQFACSMPGVDARTEELSS
jgi:hypothetical protein